MKFRALRRILQTLNFSAPLGELPITGLRRESLSAAELYQQAASIAGAHRVRTLFDPGISLRLHLRSTIRVIRKAYFTFAREGEQRKLDRRYLPPGIDWLLDNYHIIQQVQRDLKLDLSRQLYARLPKLKRGTFRGFPRVMHLAHEFVSLTDSRFERESFGEFINGYQSEKRLLVSELWALPIFVRLCLLENLRLVCDRWLQEYAAQQQLDQLLHSLPESLGGTELALALAAPLDGKSFAPPILHRLIRSLRVRGPRAALAIGFVEEKLKEHSLTFEELTRQVNAVGASDQVTMMNIFVSFKTVGSLDWKKWVEDHSSLHAELAGDPTYLQSDFETRNLYRGRIEQLAVRSDHGELVVARRLLEQLKSPNAGTGLDGQQTALKQHIGYYLIDAGQLPFERALGYRPAMRERAIRLLRAVRGPLYFGSLFAITVACALLALLAVYDESSSMSLALLAALLMAVIASEFTTHLVQWLSLRIFPPTQLAKFDFSKGIPHQYRTAVVVHALFADRSAIDHAVEGLEVRYLANRDPELTFCLLGDLPEADAQVLPQDEELLSYASTVAERMAARWPLARFVVLTRPRRWSASERRWMGWERKRGKLEEFHRFLRQRDQQHEQLFISVYGDANALRGTPFVITLDLDTQLPRGAAAKLVGTLAHPLNRPVLDDAKHRVLRGFSVIQPRVGIHISSGAATPFSRLFSGSTGIDPYTQCVSDLYQDVFGSASYIGKGIVDVDAFSSLLDGTVPEGTVLSHDLFEGERVRTALASDVELFDDIPGRYHAYARRQHRWIRGDWQLLPWLLGRAPSTTGKHVPNPFSALSRWKIFDNLRRSLVPVAYVGFLSIVWLALPSATLAWTALLAFFLAFPLFANLAAGLAGSSPRVSLSHHLKGLWSDAGRHVGQSIVAMTVLPYQAVTTIDAVTRTLYRLVVSRRHLLEWETADQADRRLSNTFVGIFGELVGGWLLASAIALALALTGSWSVAATAILGLWLFAPVAVWWMSQAHKRDTLTPEERVAVETLARETWNFFNDLLTPANNYLIPDNVQLVPKEVVATRTSPTNVSLSMLSVVAGRDLGFISSDRALELLDLISSSLEKLERFRGHFLNWYATDRMAPLSPRYVSFVDSGNMLAHFVTLQSCLQELRSSASEETAATRARAIQERLARWIAEMDFSFLYDSERKLFSIGYNVDAATRDPNCYDLLASEARLGSFMAIALGTVPEDHWFTLGRTITRSKGGDALLSWSGTAFEYLMPLLVTKSYPGSLLDRTYRAIVRAQVAYGQELGVPWGVSESAYSGVDFERTYQYRAFGVPGLGFKRGLSHDIVVSPYSTVMALMVDPSAAVANFPALDAAGLRGRYGFYEAADYTARRLTPDERVHIVQSFFSHHLGMSFVAIANALCDGVFQRRFHADPAVKATELLLQERFPRSFQALQPNQAEQRDGLNGLSETGRTGWELAATDTPHTERPVSQVLSNGRYGCLVDNAGVGLSWWNDIALTRWREDEVAATSGEFVYVRDADTGELWSTSYQPTRVEPDEYRALFNPDKFELTRRDLDISCHSELVVSPEDDVSVRRITTKNLSSRKRRIEFTSYAEVVLNRARSEAVHPAFSNMFIETEFIAELDGVICARRPRSVHEKPMFYFHLLCSPLVWNRVRFETSRHVFIGRGRTIEAPEVLGPGRVLTGSVGPVLDPIVALSHDVELEDHGTHTFSFVSGFAATREEALRIMERYHQSPTAVQRAFEMAWSQSSVELRSGQTNSVEASAYQRLATAIFFNQESARCAHEVLARNGLTQSGLWRFGISGDLPIVLVRISDPSQVALAQQALGAHDYLRARGVRFDLVLLNEFPGGYAQDLQHELEFLIRAGRSESVVEKSGGIFLRALSAISTDETTLLEAVARVVLVGSRGLLAEQLTEAVPLAEGLRTLGRSGADLVEASDYSSLLPADKLLFATKVGGFDPASGDFVMRVNRGSKPPLPWSNVIAQPNFGTLVTEAGGGFSWSENSRENRLSVWSNDPISDPASEVVYLRDKGSSIFWSATPEPCPHGEYLVRHGVGHSSFQSEMQEVACVASVRVHPSEPVKEIRIDLTNHGDKTREIEMVYYVEPVLGVLRSDSYRHLVSRFDGAHQVVAVTNRYNNEFAGRSVFIASTEPIQSYTTSRHEFVGRHGSLAQPLCLTRIRPRGLKRSGIKLSGKVGAGYNQCLALHVAVTIEPGERKDIGFFLGEARTADQLATLSARVRSVKFRAAVAAGHPRLQRAVQAVRVRTPDPGFDLMVNGWLMNQVVSCRLWGRSGFYQSGGALGFRDQLQDSLALLLADPAATREQIILHASRQFEAGDVQHWWHPPTGRGVRTTISDDLLWLPYAVCDYVEATGDLSVLREEVPYLTGQQLQPGQTDLYFQPQTSARVGSVIEHCVAAIDRSVAVGERGLPLMGGGDWNDGMNEVGHHGKGESVWLGWFLAVTLERFAPLVERDYPDKATAYREHAARLRVALNAAGWDGAWYRRAYFDDGTPLGTASAQECRIDSLAQSWAVIAGDPRGSQAFDEAVRHLVDREARIIKLLDPPFDRMEPTPGYIQGYLPGIRENGAQYTHAATWVVLAAALLGRGAQAMELWQMLNPITHTNTPQKVERYKAEPYVLCGDVYAGALPGRAGWSWYSGSAGWLYRVAIEQLLGIKRRGDSISVNPCLPDSWKQFSAEVQLGMVDGSTKSFVIKAERDSAGNWDVRY